MLDELRERDPARCIHMEMTLVLDEFLIYIVGFHSIRAVPTGQELDEVVLELGREIRDVSTGVLADDEHLAKVGFRLSVTFETVFVSALLLADLAVPSQPLKSFRLHLIGDVLRGTDWGFC